METHCLPSSKGGAVLGLGSFALITSHEPLVLRVHCYKECWWHWRHLFPLNGLLHNALQQILIWEGRNQGALERFVDLIFFCRGQALAWVLVCHTKQCKLYFAFICRQALTVVDNASETCVQSVLLPHFCLLFFSLLWSLYCRSSLNTQLGLVLYQGKCLAEQHSRKMVTVALVCTAVLPSSAHRCASLGQGQGLLFQLGCLLGRLGVLSALDHAVWWPRETGI